jgi:hypothetical protein
MVDYSSFEFSLSNSGHGVTGSESERNSKARLDSFAINIIIVDAIVITRAYWVACYSSFHVERLLAFVMV